MNDMKKWLADEKARTDSITAPAELESRLRAALDRAKPVRRKRVRPLWKAGAVAVLFAGIITGANYNAFAYYGKQLFGFDALMNGTLSRLNDEGMGQLIDKKTRLADGTELTIHGIMADANQLVLYYTLTNPAGLSEAHTEQFRPFKINGFLTHSNAESGTTIMNETHTEMKGTMTFESVSPFAKQLTLHYWEFAMDGRMTEGTLAFPYNPNQALQSAIKQQIGQRIAVDQGSVTFHSVTATPTMTVIRGTMKVDNWSRVQNPLRGIELLADDMPIALMASGSQSSPLGGIKFDLRFDTLPKQLHSLKLVMKEFVGYQRLDEQIPLASLGDEPIKLNGKELWLKKIAKTANGLELTIATAEDVMLDGVSIGTPHEKTPLKTTVNQTFVKQTDGSMLKERVLQFETGLEPEYLFMEGMHYMKTYDKEIEIPVK
ncbi:protein of unknown function [Paenibacillus sp. UNCCL117]|uniref:DUF4179 domain-containing protein n=1 Tax=unclassified Paenibacillus TaxID=185978 RepID=UPI00087FB5CA|nr:MULTISPECIES: DUF4179 domain-containing protein [unclassified Paenibacillus]SDC44516.1 protein of unknown function [Paenibacillus sp. cl123]SFW12718.1 protein of unknown function [Paenibacillus sp. UNCCL117]